MAKDLNTNIICFFRPISQKPLLDLLKHDPNNPNYNLYHNHLHRSTDGGRSVDFADSVSLNETTADLLSKARKMSNPLMDFLNILGDNGIDKSSLCESRHFCEVSRLGADPEAEVLSKMLWKIANE